MFHLYRRAVVLFLVLSGFEVSWADVQISVSLWPTGSFVAKSDALHGQIVKKSGEDMWVAKKISLELKTLKSGVELRDRHMGETYFEIGKPGFGTAELLQAKGKNGTFKGKLKVHGQEKNIEGTYSFAGPHIKASFKTKYSIFGIKKAEYMGVGVEDDIKVDVTMKFEEKKGK